MAQNGNRYPTADADRSRSRACHGSIDGFWAVGCLSIDLVVLFMVLWLFIALVGLITLAFGWALFALPAARTAIVYNADHDRRPVPGHARHAHCWRADDRRR